MALVAPSPYTGLLMATITRIAVFPIKSLDPVLLNEVPLVGPGALAQDRAYGVFDAKGGWARAKRFPQLQQLRTSWDAAFTQLTVQVPNQSAPQHFSMPAELARFTTWLSSFLGEPVTVKHDPAGGYPDEIDLFRGPTLVSTATLETVQSWFPHLALEEVRRRFRANLEISGVPAFWEDGLLAKADGSGPRLRIAGVALYGFHACARCAVPTRDSFTGIGDPQFQPRFAAQRRATLPAWADPSHFDHFYRLALCTHVAPFTPGARFRLGDTVEVIPA
jgi:uncharacterized protein